MEKRVEEFLGFIVAIQLYPELMPLIKQNTEASYEEAIKIADGVIKDTFTALDIADQYDPSDAKKLVNQIWEAV